MAVISYLSTQLENNEYIYMLWSEQTGYQTLTENVQVSVIYELTSNVALGDEVKHTLKNGNVIHITVTQMPGSTLYGNIQVTIEDSNGSVLVTAINFGFSVPAATEPRCMAIISSVDTSGETNVGTATFLLDEYSKFSGIVGFPSDNNPIKCYLKSGYTANFPYDDGATSRVYEYIKQDNPEEDPYAEGGDSTEGGGTGDFTNSSTGISVPGMPSLSAVNAGFITLYVPTVSQMAQLAAYMWTGAFDINSWKKIFADPMQAILGLSIVPVSVPSSGAQSVTVGNISTGISMNVASTQYVAVDCGTLNVGEYWGAYLDYDPYTKAEIYLPYIGTHAIAVDDIMGKSVQVIYHVDVLSGACVAYISCGGTVLYNFVGQCSSSIPITGDNWTNVVNGALSIASSIGTMVATGGASAPMSAVDIASTAVNTMKPSVEKSGAISGTGGLMGIQTPYLILTRPRQAKPTNQNKFTGYPSFITSSLGSISGYTEVFAVHLEGITGTEQEINEIESLLKSGVIF